MSKKVKSMHRGRVLQMPIYLKKQFRGFIYQNDWKVLPMAAVIAALVSMVIRKDFFVDMEGTLKGSFALTFVAIWNGCFNSIQVICRERGILKREHRSGLHVSSYVAAHMVYQAVLCLAQTVIILYVSKLCGVKFSAGKPLFTRWLIVDLGISVFLISYASDMMSLFISAIVRNTTSAMTVMPFVLIFQLVFGGFFPMTGIAKTVSGFTVSNYGLRCIAAQADYNGLPSSVGWKAVEKMKDKRITYTLTVGEAIDAVEGSTLPAVRQLADTPIALGMTLEDAADASVALGVLDPGQSLTVDTSIGEIMDAFGRERAEELIKRNTAIPNEKYEWTKDNITGCWWRLLLFIVVFALLSMISLKRIDKDKR